ncbi:MAG: DUF4340 domain-containing protein [Candidatus Neomarinimicrobiota bacterium]
MKKTLSLLFIFVTLAVFVYFYEYKGGQEREKADEIRASLLKLVEDDIESVTLSGGEDNDTITYLREDPDNWRIVSPVMTEAEISAVKGNISAFMNAKISRRLAVRKEKLQDFGLNPPAARVTIKTKENKSIELIVGDEAPTRGGLFVSVGEATLSATQPDTVEVFVTGTNVLSQARKSLFDLRDKKIAHFDNDKVRKVELTSPEGGVTLEKSGDKWVMLLPVAARVDDSRVKSFLTSTTNYSAKEFVSERLEDRKTYGFDHPTVELILSLGDERSTKEIVIGDEGENDKEFYGYESGRSPVFLIREPTKKGLSKAPFYFQDKKIIRFREEEISRIRFSGSHQVTLTKEDTLGWYAYGDSTVEVEKSQIDGLFSRLRGLGAKEIVSYSPRDLATYGLSEKPYAGVPHLEAVLADSAGDVAGFAVGDTVENDRYIKSRDYPFIYLISGSQVERLTDWLEEQTSTVSLSQKKN